MKRTLIYQIYVLSIFKLILSKFNRKYQRHLYEIEVEHIIFKYVLHQIEDMKISKLDHDEVIEMVLMHDLNLS